jgi:diguanylate cyclase (GGDEF)-like protein
MKIIAELIHKAPIWVNPEHRVESAVWLMRGHDVGGLPVLDGSELVGMLLYKHLLGVDMNRLVKDVMDTNVVVVSSTMSVRRVAELMTREKIGLLPIVKDENRLIGVVSYGDLLEELRVSVDPITELPWSDIVHEWAIEELRRGREITVLFLDVNDFGQFNKRFGHVVGDTVLRSVAGVLRDLTDTSQEALCRYGGDEFCIATLRSEEQAAALAAHIEQEIAALRVLEAPDRSITVTIGLRGGRRTREREHIHYTATLNNLINLASQDCMLRKAQKSSASDSPVLAAVHNYSVYLSSASNAPETAERAESSELANGAGVGAEGRVGVRLRLASVDVTRSGAMAHIHVELEQGSSLLEAPTSSDEATPASPGGSGDAAQDAAYTQDNQRLVVYGSDVSRATEGDGVWTLVAEATLAALRRALQPGYDLVLDDVQLTSAPDGYSQATVNGRFRTPTSELPVTGSAPGRGDTAHAVAEAVLAAMEPYWDTVLPSVTTPSQLQRAAS